jgi:ADP-heptose:LPS heptosyltransferase
MNWKVEGLKRFDSIFGRLALSLAKVTVKPRENTTWHNLNARSLPGFSGKLKILVIRPGGIGDAALLYPALKALRDNFKYAEINVLAEKRNAGILRGCPYINSVFLYDFRPPIELFKTLRTNYDIVIDTEQWHRLTATASYLTGAPIRVGFGTNKRAELFTHPVSYRHDDYEVYSFLNLVSAVTGERYDFNGNEPFIPLDSNLISSLPAILEFRKKWSATVGMFAGATVPERRWGIHNFAEISKKLHKEGIGTVIVGGRVDLKDAMKFEEIVGRENILNLVGKSSLMETAAIISQVDSFVTGDTGLMHVAYGVGTPTVSLFGAGIQKKWAPIGKSHIAINKNLFCSPCTKFGYTPRCPYNVKCLKDITVDEVKESALRLLSQRKKNDA